MTNDDRAALIELLGRLGSSDDAMVLEAARALNRKVVEAGLSWNDLIERDAGTTPAGGGEDVAAPSPDADDIKRLIERLLRTGVSDNLREDITEMKRQLAEGELDQEDRRYLRALAKRLGV